jgi:hypothetical protein
MGKRSLRKKVNSNNAIERKSSGFQSALESASLTQICGDRKPSAYKNSQTRTLLFEGGKMLHKNNMPQRKADQVSMKDMT